MLLGTRPIFPLVTLRIAFPIPLRRFPIFAMAFASRAGSAWFEASFPRLAGSTMLDADSSVGEDVKGEVSFEANDALETEDTPMAAATRRTP